MLRRHRPRSSIHRGLPAKVEPLESRTLLSVGRSMAIPISAPPAAEIRSPHYLADLAKLEIHQAVQNVAQAQALGLVPGYAHTLLTRFPDGASPDAGTGSPPATALTPAEVRKIYGFDQITNLGEGQTIAIVDAYDDPNIFADADVFDQQFMTTIDGTTSYYTAYGASSTWLTKDYASGQHVSGNTSWGQEISLDVEWAHAIAPLAKIQLVEAKSNSGTNLYAADRYAATHGATVISNSWGGGEYSRETSDDTKTFAAHGVTFVFSAGDSFGPEYPAESPDVVAVGGTTLSHDASYSWTGESYWDNSYGSGGGGVSAYEAQPAYQSSLSYPHRAAPDIAYDADPVTGFAMYDSYGANAFNPAWGQWGGTSASAPQIAALIALANQGRGPIANGGNGKGTLDGASQTLPAIYAMTTSSDPSTSSPFGADLFDVTSGTQAGSGYDLGTGRGTPRNALNTYNALVSS
jgi:subtilase family serine protease